MKNNKLKTVSTFAALALSVLVGTSTAQAGQTDEQRSLSVDLTAAAKLVNSTAPQMLDEETRLDSVATFSNYIIYNNTMVNYSASDFEVAEFERQIQTIVIDNLCGNAALAEFIQRGVVMVYRYHGKEGNYIAELAKDMSTCKKS